MNRVRQLKSRIGGWVHYGRAKRIRMQMTTIPKNVGVVYYPTVWVQS